MTECHQSAAVLGVREFGLAAGAVLRIAKLEARKQPLISAATRQRRLREIYRSAGWPCADMLEVGLLAARLLERCVGSHGHETLRLTDAGIHALAKSYAENQNARDPHESLVTRPLGTDVQTASSRD